MRGKEGNLSPPSEPPVYSPASHPRGAAIRRHVVWRGGCGACGRGLRLAPGRLREPTWGHYDPCARSSLDRAGCISRRDRSAARSFQIAAGGAPRGVRMVAQSIRAASWLNGSGSPNQRLAALRCPSHATTPAGSACGRGRRLGAGSATRTLLPSGEKVAARSADG